MTKTVEQLKVIADSNPITRKLLEMDKRTIEINEREKKMLEAMESCRDAVKPK